MEIDSKLIKFKAEIGGNISSIKSAQSNLCDDIDSFESYNNSASSSISNSFKGNVSSSVFSEIEYLNQTVSSIKSSLQTELDGVINDCNKLNDGIVELEEIKKEYETAEMNYRNANDSNKNSLSIKCNSLRSKFSSKQASLLSEYNSLINRDSSMSILQSFGKTDSSISSSLIPGVSFSSIYYETDGVIYQKVIPICKDNIPYEMDENYIVAYNKEAILKVAEASGNRTVGEEVINFITSKMNGTNQSQYLYDYCANSYKSNDSKVIGAVMDQILNDTYVVMGCKSISDYAVVSGVTINSSILHLGYGGAGNNTWCKGITNALTSSGTLECSGLTRWCYAQGIYNYYKDSDLDYTQVKQMAGDTTPGAFLWHCSSSFTNMSAEDIINLEPGCLVSKRTPGNIHIGMLVGHTKVNGEDALVFVQSSNTTIGVNFRVATVSELQSGNSWVSVSTPERSAGVFTQNLSANA